MLVRVAPGQVRFVLPGLSADAGGLTTGPQIIARFPTLDRVVTFLRLLTASHNLDDLGATPRVLFARPRHGLREALVFFDAVTPLALDAVSEAARTALGQTFVGRGRHFVLTRDRTAPVGYDVEALAAEEGDILIYGQAGVSSFAIENELSLEAAVFRLELLPAFRSPLGPFISSTDQQSSERGLEQVFVLARSGIASSFIALLLREGLDGRWARLESQEGVLFELANPPRRLDHLLKNTPGLTTFIPVSERIAIANGHEHPLHLESCLSAFPREQLTLLRPPGQTHLVIRPMPVFTDVRDGFTNDTRLVASKKRVVQPQSDTPLRVPLRLVPSSFATAHATRPCAALIPQEKRHWLLQLVLALPPGMVANHRVAELDEGLLVVAEEALTWLPLGRLFSRAAPGVLTPLGFSIRPAVSPETLSEQLGAGSAGDGADEVIFFEETGAPWRIPSSAFAPLDARLVEGSEVREREIDQSARSKSSEDPKLVFRSTRFLPVWGPR